MGTVYIHKEPNILLELTNVRVKQQKTQKTKILFRNND